MKKVPQEAKKLKKSQKLDIVVARLVLALARGAHDEFERQGGDQVDPEPLLHIPSGY